MLGIRSKRADGYAVSRRNGPVRRNQGLSKRRRHFVGTWRGATTGPARAETDRTRLNERCSEYVRFDRSHVRYVEAGRAQWARRWSCARPCECYDLSHARFTAYPFRSPLASGRVTREGNWRARDLAEQRNRSAAAPR